MSVVATGAGYFIEKARKPTTHRTLNVEPAK